MQGHKTNMSMQVPDWNTRGSGGRKFGFLLRVLSIVNPVLVSIGSRCHVTLFVTLFASTGPVEANNVTVAYLERKGPSHRVADT